jgi:hypothetical protein
VSFCQEGKDKTDGIIALHRPFSKYYWAVHEQGDKHYKLLKQHCGGENLIAEGKVKEEKNQAHLFEYFLSAGKKKKYLPMKDGSVALAAGGLLSADNRAVSKSIVRVQNKFAYAGKMVFGHCLCWGIQLS